MTHRAAAVWPEALRPSFYFLDLSRPPFAPLFEGVGFVWEAVKEIGPFIQAMISSRAKETRPSDCPPEMTFHEGMLTVERWVIAPRDLLFPELLIWIGKGTCLEPGVLIKSSALIESGAEIRQGAYLRGPVAIGPGAIVGHVTEVKNSVFLEGAEAGHFAYVGDSLLGRRVNLGAGTKLANLELRSPREKGKTSRIQLPWEEGRKRAGAETLDRSEDKGDPGRARSQGRERLGQKTALPLVDGRLDTGLQKLGAILGDDVEVGCNAVTSPGTLVGPRSWVYPNTTVRKGFYPADHIIRPGARDLEVVLRRD